MNSNDQWNNQDQLGTTPHWMASEAWDYFNNIHEWNGMNGKANKIRIWANDTDLANARYWHKKLSTIDNLDFGFINNSYLSVIDIVGHEFTHGVVHYTAKLHNTFEPGALNESFADIFGTLIEGYAEGTITDWIHGEDANQPLFDQRSFAAPKTMGTHEEIINNFCTIFLGQPDTRLGINWWDLGSPLLCDYGGVHINCSIQNYWFYLLSVGGSGINDFGNKYNIQGIGSNEAGDIAFWNLTNVLQKASTFFDARQGSITSAQLLFGICSNEERQTTNAWAAVFVGEKSNCTQTGITEKENNIKPLVYPIPAHDNLTIELNGNDIYQLKMFDSNAKLVYHNYYKGNKILLDIQNILPGFYYLEIKNDQKVYYLKMVKI